MREGETLYAQILNQDRLETALFWNGLLVTEMSVPRQGGSRMDSCVTTNAIVGNTHRLRDAYPHAAHLQSDGDAIFFATLAADASDDRVAIQKVARDESPQTVAGLPRQLVSLSVRSGKLLAVIWADPSAKSLTDDRDLARERAVSGATAAISTSSHWAHGSPRKDGAVLRPLLLDVNGADPILAPNLDAGWEYSGQVALGADGAAVSATLDMGDGHIRFGVVLLTAQGEVDRYVLHPDIDLSHPIASPSGKRYMCHGETVSKPDRAPRQFPVEVEDGGAMRRLPIEMDEWITPVCWLTENLCICTMYEEGRVTLWVADVITGAFERAGIWRQLVDRSVSGVRVFDGIATLTVSSIDSPPAALVFSAAELEPDKPQTASIAMHTFTPAQVTVEATGRLERVTLSSLGLDLGAWICMPETAHQSTSVPLLVWCHGGPAVSWTDWSWRWNPWPFVAEGYAVALVDSTMSQGYGQRAVEDGWGRWSTSVVETLVAQIQQILGSDPRLDASQLAVMGASFGGWQALALGGRLPSVKFVAAHAGWRDLRSVARTSNQHWHWLREFGPTTSERFTDEAMDLRAYANGTRVCLSHGMLDVHVPPSEALGVFRDLQEHGASVELMTFADESHSLARPVNAMIRLDWILQNLRLAFSARRP